MKKVISILLFWVLLAQSGVVGAEGYYYHYDHLGSVDIVTDEEGDVVAEYDYYPFGEVYEEIIYDEEYSNSYKYTGQEEDEETGLYYYGSRYYDAGVGSFMSQDPALYDERLLDMLRDPQSLNTYAYVLNNPVKYTDPSGESLVGVLEFIGIGAGIEAVAAVVVVTVAVIVTEVVTEVMDAVTNVVADVVSEAVAGSNTASSTVDVSPPVVRGDDGKAKKEYTEWGKGGGEGSPGPGWTQPGGEDSNWYNEDTGESLRYDATHEGEPSHIDYKDPSGEWGRINIDTGEIIPK